METRSIYDFSLKTLEGKVFPLSELKGKVRDYHGMNDLQSKFGDSLAIVAVPCNQFGHQENATDDEILNCLKHVRPGKGFEPKFPLMARADVNGEKALPVFTFLKESLPFPSDNQFGFFNDPKFIIWSPVTRVDINWNFEKFLVGKDGVPLKRFSPKFPAIDISADIEAALQ